MPALLWVVFWSSIMGTAACWDEVRRPIKAETLEKSDLASGR